MVAKRSSRAVALLLVVPSAAFALGLGDIRLLSPLDQPLKAQIELLDASPDALQNLQVQLASQDTFARYGLSWPQFLSDVHVKTLRTADGREVVELTSDQPITDPVLTLLVEANWDRGHLIREYTVLLDPPVYVPNQSQAAAQQVAPAATGTAQRGGEIARPESRAAEAPAQAPAAQAAAPAAAAPGSAGSSADESAPASAAPAGGEPHSLIVHRGQTLSGIASRLSGSGPGSGPTRSWMVAIYQANPDAFARNMNLLRSGAVLRVPDSASVAAISSTDATAEVRRQYAAWRGASQEAAGAGSGPGRLRLVAPQGGAGASGSAATAGSSSGEVKSLQAQVQSLQTQLSDEHRLLQLKDAQLASMQAQLAAGKAPQAAPAESPPVAGSPPTASSVNHEQANPPPAATQTPAQPPPSEAAQPPPVASTPAPQHAPTAAPHMAHRPPAKAANSFKASSGPSLFDTLASYWWVIAALVAAALGYLGFKSWRSRRQSDLDDSLGRLAAAGASPSPYTRLEPSPGDTASIRPAAAEHDDSFVVEETGTHERPRIAAAAGPVSAKHVTTADQTISSETAVNLDQGDPLAEADFHMAYGLYDQAADLIRIAIGREPERRDLKLKLLEVFFVWGNKEQFLQTARELAASRAEAAPGEWEKIVIMGKQLAPEDPLFAGGAAVSGAASAGVDLDLAGGQVAGLDFDVASGRTGQHAQGLDLDIGSALGETESGAVTVESPGTATDRNMALLDTHFADNATGSTREMTATMPGGDEIPGEFGTEIEGPTIEQPALYVSEQPTIRQKVETALKQGNPEQTAELAIDDLGLDLGAFEAVDQAGEATEASSEAPTMVAGLDEHSRRIMEQASQRPAEPSPEPTGTTNAWQIDESELEAVLTEGDGRANGHDTAATSRLAALDAGGVDYELSAAEHEAAGHGANGADLDLDVGTATVPDTAFTATQKLSADDLALPDLEPVTMSEVGTKLDLARAYMDMGDPEGARNILEEVMQEGSTAQRQEAERLMESLPG
ncbi:MAG TPA: FimV/HubP family polar landmark protein [Steroidobacteraceae bacterium]|nr:FimV/HubP family polar landmark protein [Steroidobacteraceae bacterium]